MVIAPVERIVWTGKTDLEQSLSLPENIGKKGRDYEWWTFRIWAMADQRNRR